MQLIHVRWWKTRQQPELSMNKGGWRCRWRTKGARWRAAAWGMESGGQHGETWKGMRDLSWGRNRMPNNLSTPLCSVLNTHDIHSCNSQHKLYLFYNSENGHYSNLFTLSVVCIHLLHAILECMYLKSHWTLCFHS